jgi:hypothetical protein
MAQRRQGISRRQFARLSAAGAIGLSRPSVSAQPAVPPLRSEFLMDLIFKTGGGGAVGPRRISGITEGTFQGPKLKGKVVTPAGEWGATRSDGAYVIDVRMELQTDDSSLIFAAYRGIIYTPPKGQGDRYWVTTPVFETAAEKYDWLNRIVCVAVSYAVPGSVAYHVYQILI